MVFITFSPYKSMGAQIWPCHKKVKAQSTTIIWTNLVDLESILFNSAEPFEQFVNTLLTEGPMWNLVKIAREVSVWWKLFELLQRRRHLTRGPWWSYIAHLSKQLCILTVEVSAKFTALRFLYKFYSPAPQRPCFFSCIMMAWTESWKRITKGTILQRYIEIGPVVSDKRFLKCFI